MKETCQNTFIELQIVYNLSVPALDKGFRID